MEIRELATPAELAAVDELAGLIWRTAGSAVMPPELLRVLAVTGSYVGGAFDGPRLVGFAVGLLGRHDGELELHSHVAGVHPEAQGSGVGFALKVDQRRWALERGIGRITWTFDPLVRRNAAFNLAKLGAAATDYLIDFYGAMSDGVNAGQGSDRWWVRWDLSSPRVTAAVAGQRCFADGEPLRAAGRLLVGPDGAPGVAVDGQPLLCPTPADVEALRVADAGAALRWRTSVRAALTAALGAGYHVAGVTRDGSYLLRT
jgi:predicted GNAT superfamily acetyltransferase